MSFTKTKYARNGFPLPGEELKDTAGRHNREGWTEMATHTSIVLHGKQYRNMKEWSRPCVLCGERFSAFEGAMRPDANSQFSNKTCAAHRGLMPAFERGYLAWSTEPRGIIPGVMCVSAALDTSEVTKERDEAWEKNVELTVERGRLIRENEALKAELAKYQLQPAMREIKNKMPWEA